MLEKIELIELKRANLDENSLKDFNRYQPTKRIYVKENGNWIIKENNKIWDWNKNFKEYRIKKVIEIIQSGGYVLGAYENEKLIGFASLLNEKFGTKKQYIELKHIYVSYRYRNKGIGKKLFEMCVKKAKEIGIKKIYISANSSEESQCFYLGIGCRDAIEEKENYDENDRQMEYEL